MQVLKKLIVFSLPVFWAYGVQAQTLNPGDSAIVISKNYTNAVTVTGKITDAATGKPLQGVNITYKEYSAAISDSLGGFSLHVPSLKVPIRFEADGYQLKEVALNGETTVAASLYEDTYVSYYDLAAEPMGAVMKSKTPFAAASLQTNGNWNSISETPSTWLQGKVAGLNAIRRSGTPNEGATLTLRGISSLYANAQPLIVVDGILFDNRDYGGSIIANHYTDPLSTIDVRDIDNITVLKDGSSIYGTKGANGVIIITTARAKELDTRIDFSVSGGINFIPKNIPLMQAGDYRTYLSEILKSKGLSDSAIQAMPYMSDDVNNPEYYKYHNNTDWQKQVFNKSYTKNIYLKVTGGDNIAKYALSLGFMNNDGITRNTDLTRYNMRFNGDLNLSRRMTATTNLSFTFNEQNLRDQGHVSPKTNPILLALFKSPLVRTNDVSEKGIESPTFADKDTFGIGNPLAITNLAEGNNKSYRFLGSIGFNYQLGKNLGLSTTFGVTNDKVRENFFIPRKGVANDTLSTDIADSRLGSQLTSLFSLYNDTRLSFDKHIRNIHELSSHLGVRYLYNKSEQDYGLGYNSPIDELVSVGNGANSLRRIGGFTGESNWLSTYFNTDYTFLDKYFFSVNVAVDGSSRFGTDIPGALTISGNKYAVLPSIAGAWLLSSEKFNRGKIFNLLKLRASYGLSGNDDIGNYTARQTYVSQNLLGVQGLVRAGVGNNQLQWEKMQKLNIGTDISVLNERVNLSVDVYQHTVNKMVIYESAPIASGFDFAATNTGGMKLSGVEVAASVRIINHPDLKWDAGFTIASSSSHITKLPTQNIISSFAGASYITHVKDPVSFYGYKANGVYASDAIALSEGLSVRRQDGTLAGFKGGDVRFADLNNDKIIDDQDRQIIGNPAPDAFGSLSSRVSYKKITLEAFFTFTAGNDIYNYTRNQLEAVSGFNNQTLSVLNRWRSNGQVTDVPKATWGDPMGNSRFSDRWIEDGSYIRLRTVSLSYNVPLRLGFVKYAVVYFNANNLFTITKYKGYDPEFSATESIFGQGVDNALEPQFKSVQLGVRIGL